MRIVKEKDVIAWRDGNRVICTSCGDSGDAIPLTEDDFADDDIVTCDSCPPGDNRIR